MMLPPGLAVEAVRDDVAGVEHFEHFVIERRRFADMHHQRQLQHRADLLGDA